MPIKNAHTGVFLVNKYQTQNIIYPHCFYYTDGRTTSVIRYRTNDTVLILGLIHDRFHIYVTDGITIQVFLLLRHVCFYLILVITISTGNCGGTSVINNSAPIWNITLGGLKTVKI